MIVKEFVLICSGLETVTFNDMIEMDKNYLSRMLLRKRIISEHPEMVIQAQSVIIPAVNELYTYLLGTYLPCRYPTMFKLTSPSHMDSPTSLYNTVTKQTLSLLPSPDPLRSLEILGENLDEDFLLMLPSEDNDQYVLRGYVLCFPSGFNTKEKLGLKLREIHTPVPGYKEKLERSMDRFFDRLEPGKIVRRSNVGNQIPDSWGTQALTKKQWAITTHSQLYSPTGNHLYNGEEFVEEVIDMKNVF
jgi:hypothetical protein